MRSADAPVSRLYTGPTESSAEVHVEYMKDREWVSTQNNFSESKANRKWQNTWRRKHPIIYRNQSWLYRTTRRIHAELMNAFPELPEKRLYRTVMEDLRDAFPDEWKTRTDRQPRLITAIEPVLSLPRTQMLLKSFQIPCDVFYSALDARRYRQYSDLHDVWGQLPPGCGRGPMHLLERIQGRHLDEHEVWSWSKLPPGGGRAPLMHLFVRGCGHLFEREISTMKKQILGETEAIPPSLCQRRRMVSQLTLCPVGSPMQPRVFNALLKMLRARRPF